MTTVETLPDLEAWLNHEVEKPCECMTWGKRCELPATWVAHLRYDNGCPPETALLCERCKRAVCMGEGACCKVHNAIARVTWIERSRRPS